jgi:hypothetical protein
MRTGTASKGARRATECSGMEATAVGEAPGAEPAAPLSPLPMANEGRRTVALVERMAGCCSTGLARSSSGFSREGPTTLLAGGVRVSATGARDQGEIEATGAGSRGQQQLQKQHADLECPRARPRE